VSPIHSRLAADGEIALALSDSYIVAVTTKDYVRVYTLFGTPYKVYRQKSPAVTCAAWRDYVMTIGNGPLGSDGLTATLTYSIENVKRDEVCQNEDVVALPEGSELRSVFFSDTGVSLRRGSNDSIGGILIIFPGSLHLRFRRCPSHLAALAY
jgi:hypothetical protein